MAKQLTKAEEQIMQVLWDLEETSVKEVIEKLPEPKPAYNTVSTIIRILETKEFVAHKEEGRGYVYYPIIDKDTYSNESLHKLMNWYFQGSFKSMVSFFVKENEIKVLRKKGFLNRINERTVVGTETVSFMTIDKVPVFPGCEDGDKACFSRMVQKHFVKNFDSKIPKTLGLSPGKKRVFIGFKIDKEGDVVDVISRAPHPEIEKEVIRVMETLPKIQPGENKGKKVSVKYSIPFTLFVE